MMINDEQNKQNNYGYSVHPSYIATLFVLESAVSHTKTFYTLPGFVLCAFSFPGGVSDTYSCVAPLPQGFNLLGPRLSKCWGTRGLEL